MEGVLHSVSHAVVIILDSVNVILSSTGDRSRSDLVASFQVIRTIIVVLGFGEYTLVTFRSDR